MDIWLGRDGDVAVLLVQLAEAGKVELILPEFVLIEFRGTALRWIREQRAALDSSVRPHAKAWARSKPLGEAADDMRDAAAKLARELDTLASNIEAVRSRLQAVAKVVPHTVDVHFKGDLRYLGGYPPDRPVDGIKDCRIYEAVLEIAKADTANVRARRVYVTKDRDFANFGELVTELRGYDVELAGNLGQLYGELR
ncbi:PIN domain-containing protein [Sorangium sp. KYC3313]|uniref:PIN domain-containing protein n=1 Tax=Sorangium sp. KYC3313 TaxID=3449740 RepID=UPI003F8A8696